MSSLQIGDSSKEISSASLSLTVQEAPVRQLMDKIESLTQLKQELHAIQKTKGKSHLHEIAQLRQKLEILVPHAQGALTSAKKQGAFLSVAIRSVESSLEQVHQELDERKKQTISASLTDMPPDILQNIFRLLPCKTLAKGIAPVNRKFFHQSMEAAVAIKIAETESIVQKMMNLLSTKKIDGGSVVLSKLNDIKESVRNRLGATKKFDVLEEKADAIVDEMVELVRTIGKEGEGLGWLFDCFLAAGDLTKAEEMLEKTPLVYADSKLLRLECLITLVSAYATPTHLRQGDFNKALICLKKLLSEAYLESDYRRISQLYDRPISAIKSLIDIVILNKDSNWQNQLDQIAHVFDDPWILDQIDRSLTDSALQLIDKYKDTLHTQPSDKASIVTALALADKINKPEIRSDVQRRIIGILL